MKPIEAVIRSAKWDRATQAKLRAHLAKPMTDDARLEYCRRKAYFLAEGGKLDHGIALLEWALATYEESDESPYPWYARADLGELRRARAAANAVADRPSPDVAQPHAGSATERLQGDRLGGAPETLAVSELGRPAGRTRRPPVHLTIVKT